MVFGLWMVPLTLGYLSPTKYGIWLTLTSIIAWFNFFDIGIGNGLRNKLGEALAKKNYILAKGYVSTGYAFMIIIVGVLFLLFVLSSLVLDWNDVLNISSEIEDDITALVLFVFSFFCFRFVFGLILVVLNADQKLSASGFIDLITNLLSILAIYLISKTIDNNKLFVLGSSLSLIPVIVLASASIWLYRKKYSEIKPALAFVNFKLAHDLTSLSFQFFILQIMVLLIFFSNNIIIAQLLSPAKVTEFNVVHKYFNVITTISILVLNPFWSAATNAYFREDFDWLKKSSQKLIKLWLLISLGSVIMILIAPYVYSWWLKNQVQISFKASLLMGIYVIVLSWTNSFIYLINGIGKIRLQLYIYSLMALLVIPMSYFFIAILKMGIEGSILSTILCLLPAAVVIPIQFKAIASGKAQGIFNK